MSEHDSGCPECSGEFARLAVTCTTHVTGDERLVALLQCRECQRYYVEDWVDVGGWDDSPTEITERLFGPLPRDRAAAVLTDMETCPDPHHRSCRCPVHARLDALIEELPTCRIVSRRMVARPARA
jgi:hypothetical protein